jgi:hypothetical protein
LQLKFYTQTEKQDFCIKSLEFTKIKVKQIWLLLELQNTLCLIIQSAESSLNNIKK